MASSFDGSFSIRPKHWFVTHLPSGVIKYRRVSIPTPDMAHPFPETDIGLDTASGIAYRGEDRYRALCMCPEIGSRAALVIGTNT